MFTRFNNQIIGNPDFDFLQNEILNQENTPSAISKIYSKIRPSKVRFDLNDKLAKVIFHLSDESKSGDTSYFIEKNAKKLEEIATACNILSAAGYQVVRPFNMFDRFVMSACISEWLAGNRYTTAAIIYRALTGKIGKDDSKPGVAQHKAIIGSLRVLMSRKSNYSPESLYRATNHKSDDALSGKSPLLPAIYIDFSVPDSETETLVFFTGEPPLLKISQIKNQLISYDATLLDMPGQDTLLNITVKNHTILCLQELKLQKQLTPTITFSDVFKSLCIKKSNSKTKMDIRNTMLEFFEHLKSKGVVKDFEVIKRGDIFYGINFTHSPKP